MLKKTPHVILIFSLIFLLYYSIKQWRAESAYPIQRSFIHADRSKEITDDKEAEQVKYAISLFPGNYRYHALLGKYYVYKAPKYNPAYKDIMALLRKSEKEYLKALSLNPSYTEALAYLGWVKFSLGDPFKALDLLETAVRLDPDNYFNHLFYGICLSSFLNSLPEDLRESYIHRAEEEFNKGVELNPKMARHPSVFMSRANLYLKKGDIESAIEQLKKAGRIDNSSLPYHLKLTGLLLKSSKVEKGVRRYERLLEHPGIDAEGKKMIIESLRRESKKYSENIRLKLFLGKAYFEGKDWDNALKTLKEVVSDKPKVAEAHYMMGEIYELKGDKDAAYNEYITTLMYSKKHPGASKRILELSKELLKDRESGK